MATKANYFYSISKNNGNLRFFRYIFVLQALGDIPCTFFHRWRHHPLFMGWRVTIQTTMLLVTRRIRLTIKRALIMHQNSAVKTSRSMCALHRTVVAEQMLLLPRDPLFVALSKLGLVTPAFLEHYRFERRRAVEQMNREMVFLQQLYEGTVPEMQTSSSAVQVGAMELNVHLTNTAGFGNYSNAQKINILYQLRRVLSVLQKQYLPSHAGESFKL